MAAERGLAPRLRELTAQCAPLTLYRNKMVVVAGFAPATF